jgi:hypothetical protein
MPKGQLTVEQRLRQTVTRLKNENARLRVRVALLERENMLLKEQVQDVLVQLEELQRKVFGRKWRKPPSRSDTPNPPSSPRTPETYRRPPPLQDEITLTKDFPLESCTNCHSPLSNLKVIVRYQEDVLPPEEWHKALKRVEKHLIATGYCPHCSKRVSAQPISPHLVSLGENVKQFVPYLCVAQRMSFEQIRNFLQDTARLSLSDGEINNILEAQSHALYPRFETIKESISKQKGGHYDETSWKTQQEHHGNFAWVKTGTETPDTLFLLGQSRGKGNAQELRGENQEQIGITDDYGAYRTLFEQHQLCWAHPLRKLRDLTQSEHLTPEQRASCQLTYESFALVYEELRAILQEPFDLPQRAVIRQKLQRKFQKLAIVSDKDPPKLKRIKQSLGQNQESYFTCLLHEGIPADNNKAERRLRHLVLKRKVSFGSKTQKGADAMSILCSVLLSLWWAKPRNFFAEYAKLFQPNPA